MLRGSQVYLIYNMLVFVVMILNRFRNCNPEGKKTILLFMPTATQHCTILCSEQV